MKVIKKTKCLQRKPRRLGDRSKKRRVSNSSYWKFLINLCTEILEEERRLQEEAERKAAEEEAERQRIAEEKRRIAEEKRIKEELERLALEAVSNNSYLWWIDR